LSACLVQKKSLQKQESFREQWDQHGRKKDKKNYMWVVNVGKGGQCGNTEEKNEQILADDQNQTPM
jgi:hypothetical protein